MASSIQQEEDMLRYLYAHKRNSPLLARFEKELLLLPLEGEIRKQVEKKCSALPEKVRGVNSDTQTDVYLTVVAQLSNSVVLSPHTHSHRDYVKVLDTAGFKREFNKYTNGALKHVNWNNILVVGGSVLRSIHSDLYWPTDDTAASDIDIYIYGLNIAQAKEKVPVLCKFET